MDDPRTPDPGSELARLDDAYGEQWDLGYRPGSGLWWAVALDGGAMLAADSADGLARLLDELAGGWQPGSPG
jgi:hypothetical protein